MGIALAAADWVLGAVRERAMGGRCLTLGRQDVSFGLDDLYRLLARHDLAVIEDGEVALDPKRSVIVREMDFAGTLLSHNPYYRRMGCISDVCLFRLFGFDEVLSLDASDYEGADIIFDLNGAGIGQVLDEPVDLVVDGGTIEHVFHVPNCLGNIFEALKEGGQVMHMSPANNHLDHGFYQFSPTFFHDYYRANRFADLSIQLVRTEQVENAAPWTFTDYRPGDLREVSKGTLDDKVYLSFVIARKSADSTANAVPQQGYYEQTMWNA